MIKCNLWIDFIKRGMSIFYFKIWLKLSDNFFSLFNLMKVVIPRDYRYLTLSHYVHLDSPSFASGVSSHTSIDLSLKLTNIFFKNIALKSNLFSHAKIVVLFYKYRITRNNLVTFRTKLKSKHSLNVKAYQYKMTVMYLYIYIKLH